MNDRCDAGTGKFLEITAGTLGCDIENFGRQALMAENDISISSMCKVFAECEVTSLIAKGRGLPGESPWPASQCDQPDGIIRRYRLHRRRGHSLCIRDPLS